MLWLCVNRSRDYFCIIVVFTYIYIYIYIYIYCMSYKISSSSRIFQSQTEYGWLTRPCLSCHMWKLIMQLGQAQPAFANWEKVWLDM